ncbi:MAG: chemotaxis protein CheW [Deltaproteobacteria bacterium]
MAAKQYVVFGIEDESFALDIEKVKEIIKPVEIAKVPNVPEFIEGMINMRGKVHAVINIRSKFKIPKKDFDEGTKIILINMNSMLAGIIVDSVSEIVRVESEDIGDTPEIITKANPEYIKGVIKKEGRMVIILDIDSVIDSAA